MDNTFSGKDLQNINNSFPGSKYNNKAHTLQY